MKNLSQFCAIVAASAFFVMPIIADKHSQEKPTASPTVYVAKSKSNMAMFSHTIPMNMLPLSSKTGQITPKQVPFPQPNPPIETHLVVTHSKTKSATVLSPTAGTKYSHGNPTNAEQYILELINRGRADPKAEGERIAASKDADLLQAISSWKIDINKVKAEFATYPKRPPLAFHEKIIDAARGHSDWMVETGIQDHTGRNGSSPFQRMNAAGYTGWSSAGENIFKDAVNLWYGHCGFQIDWGTENQATLGHRRNIMNFDGEVYREIGVGITQHSGSYAITEDFGNRGINFIVGVVYKDNNNNGFYDMGEGLPGVTITPSKGTYYAVTSSSGGYAIPVQDVTGSVTVEASGGGLGAIVTKNISLSGENVKVDFTSPLPGQVSLAYPPPGEVLATQSVTFKWYKSPGSVTGYWFELADNETFTNPLISKQDITDTSITVPDLKNGTTYYWHVKARTAAGWGDYTAANDFSVYIIPPPPVILTPNESVINTDSLKCVWKKGDASVTKYWIELSDRDDFFTTILIDSNLTETSYTFRNLKYEKTYYWHVAAKNSELWSDFSDVREFMPLQLPKQVELAYPADNYTTKNPKITFGWFEKDPQNVTAYWFEIGTDADMKNIFISDTTMTDTFKVLTSLNPGVQYFWHVRQSNAAGWGEFSPIRKAMITTTGVEDDILAARLNVAATPNPASSEVMISFELPHSAFASLEVVNTIGQTVSTLAYKTLAAGKHQFVWNVDNVESGMYYYRLKAGNDMLTLPIVVLK
jgi:uncharacterized protein YkwD